MAESRDTTPSRHDGALPEGEEGPPPGTRVMAIVRWVIVALMAALAAGAWIQHAASSASTSDAARFHCPMHPSVLAAQRGECPICGMDLVAVADEGAHGGASARKASAAADHEAGRPAAPGAAARPGATEYVCPMSCVPTFATTDPHGRCPACGMKLVARQDAGGAAGARVPGLAPVQLSEERTQLIGLRTAAATRARLAPTLRTIGFVTANEGGVVSVSTRFSGWVETLAVAETGRLVEKGQVLATIYSPEMVTAQQVFLNAIKFSEKRPVATGGATVPPIATDLDRDARLRLELAGVAREDVELIAASGQTRQTVNLRAPVRGYVARRSAVKGLYVQPGTELFQLADLSTVWVIADVYESEMSRVKVGQKAVLTVAAHPGEPFQGRVQFIYPAVNPGSRTLQARLEFRNGALRLRPGMYGDVALELGAEEAVVVPRDALVDTGDLQYVFVARDGGRFEPRRVRAGRESGGMIAILDGLHEGERVVTAASFLLDSESRLRAAIEGAP